MMVIFVLYYQSSHFCCWLKSTTLCNVFLITHTECILNSLSKSLPFCPWDTSDQTIKTIDSKKYYCCYYLILSNEYWLPYQLRRCYHTNSDVATIPTRTLLPYQLRRCYHTNSDVATIPTRTLLPYQLGHCYYTNPDIATIPTRTLLPYQLGRCYHTNSDVATIPPRTLLPYQLRC